MKNISKYKHTFIILASIIIALLNTLPYFSSILYSSDNAESPWMRSGFIITRSLWYMAQSFVAVIILLYFNYSWIKYITPKRTKRAINIILMVVYNLLLAYALLWLTILVAEITVGNPFGIKGAIYFYAWKFVYILPLVILIAYVLKLVIKAKIVEIENFKLREENLNVQIKSLKDQVNPHFLFNTLNTLSSLIRLDHKEDGIQFIEDLSKVYRYILESEKHEMVRVDHELEVLDSLYFVLQKRFGDNLKIKIDIENEKLGTMMPPMVFQHLIENAIKHNEISTASPLEITITNDEEYIIVKNPIKQRTDGSKSLGIGLPNLIKQYKLIAGKDVIIQQKDNHFVVKLPMIHP